MSENHVSPEDQNPNKIATAPAFVDYKCTNLMAHLVSENYDVVKRMVTKNLNIIEPNIKDIEGKTVLALAAKMNRTDIVDFLLETLAGKIEVNVQDNEGNTPLHYAFAYGNKEMITALLRHGAQKHLKNTHGLKVEDMLSLPEKTIVQFLDSVAIDAERDVNATFNTPSFLKPGDNLLSENVVNSWKYLESILKELDNEKFEKIRSNILAIETNYAKISLREDIQKKKVDPKPLLELLNTIKPTSKSVDTFKTTLAPAFSSSKSEKKEMRKKSAIDLVRSALYAEDIKMIKDKSGEEALQVKVLEHDVEHFVKTYNAEVIDLENHVIQLPKNAAIGLLQREGLETLGGQSIWDALKQELNFGSPKSSL